MPVTKIRSRWDSGNLIFHESSSLGVIADVLKLATTGVTVGSATNDINFSWLGTTTGTFDLDAGAHTLVTTGLDWTITGDIDLTGNLTVDVGDVQIGDDDFLMFGDGTGGDVNIEWDTSGTDQLKVLPLADNTLIAVGNGTLSCDLQIFGGTANYYIDFDADEETGGTWNFGQDQYGIDVKFFGAATGNYLLWDQSTDDLIQGGTAVQFILNSTVNSTTTGSGSIHTLGGLGVALNSFFGGTLSVGTISAINEAGPTIINEAATTTNPTLNPNRADLTTGIGWNTTELHFVVGGVDEVQVTALILAPGVTDACALGSTSYYWSDLFLASEAVINFAADITLTHAANLLTFAGGNLRMGTTDRIEFLDATEYIYASTDGQIDIVAATTVALSGAVTADSSITATGAILPTVSGTPALGSATLMWSDLFLADTAVINFNNGNLTLTHSAGLLTLSNALTVTGAVIGSTTLAVTSTDAATPVNAIYGYNDAGANFTTGNQVGVRGKVACDVTSGDVYSMTGVWAGVQWSAGFAASGHGLSCAINAEAVTATDVAVGHPNAILYLQSLPTNASATHASMPYIVFTETPTGTGSNILFELGHDAAATRTTITEGTLFWHDTIQIAVNLTAGDRTAYYIPLSTAQGTFTFAYPIYGTVTHGDIGDNNVYANTLTSTGTFSHVSQGGFFCGLESNVTTSGSNGLCALGLRAVLTDGADSITGYGAAGCFKYVMTSAAVSSHHMSAVVDLTDNDSSTGGGPNPMSCYMRIYQQGTKDSADGRRNFVNFASEDLASNYTSDRMVATSTAQTQTHSVRCYVDDEVLYLMATTTAPQN